MRLVLCLLLALAAAPAWAEWVKLGETDEMAFYIDPATIRKDGNLRKVWVVNDMKQRHKDGEMSWRYLNEYDCKEERNRILSLTTHSDPMASGKILISEDGRPDRWHYIPPNSPFNTILKIVCAK